MMNAREDKHEETAPPANTGRVRYVLFSVPLHPGNLTLVEMEDGTLRVLMNDRPVTGCHWVPDNLGLAVQKFQEIKSKVVPRQDPRQ